MDPDGSFLIDVRLPDREEASNSLTSLLTEIMYSLSGTHGTAAAAAGGAGAAGPDDGAVAAAAAAAPGSAAAAAEPAKRASAGGAPLLHNPVVGQLSVRK